MKKRNLKNNIYLALSVSLGLLLAPNAWACFNSNGGAVSCSSSACDPAKSAAGGGQCLSTPSTTATPTAVPEPTPALPTPGVNAPSTTTPTESGENFALKNRTPYYLETEWYRDPIRDLFEGRREFFRESKLPEDLAWMEEFFEPGPTGPRLAAMYNERFEDDFRLMQLREKEKTWYDWITGVYERAEKIRERISLSLTEDDKYVTDYSWSDTVDRNANYDPEYRKLTKILRDNENENPLTPSDQKAKDALEQKIRYRDSPIRTGVWGDPIEVDEDAYLTHEEIKDYERYKKMRLIEIESNASTPHSIISEVQGVVPLN